MSSEDLGLRRGEHCTPNPTRLLVARLAWGSTFSFLQAVDCLVIVPIIMWNRLSPPILPYHAIILFLFLCAIVGFFF